MQINKIVAGVSLIAILAVSSATPGYAARPGNGGGQVAAKSVCIDAGHGGSETGTSNGGILEKDLNLDVALRLGDVLAGSGYTTHYTRTADVYMDRADRATFCNSTDAALLVSVHHNGSTDSSADYTVALYHSNSSKNLAKIVGQEAANEFGMGGTFRIERFANMMLMKSEMPSIISESYFLTNSDRLLQLQLDHAGMVDREANALKRGIDAFLSA